MSIPTAHTENQAAANAVTKRRFQTLLEKGSEAYFETDGDGRLLFFNHAFARLMSPFCRPETGDALAGLFDSRHKAGLQAYMDEVIDQGGPDRIYGPVNGCDSDRDHRRFELRLGQVLEDNVITGCYGFVRELAHDQDVQVKEFGRDSGADPADSPAGRRFRTFLDFLPDPVCVFNQDNTVSYFNPAFERVFGWSLNELAGCIIPFIPENEKEPTRRASARLEKEILVHGFESMRLAKDGSLRDVIFDAAMYRDEHNRPAGKVVILRDVTREKRFARTHQTLSRISMALHQHHELHSLLTFITDEIRSLIGVKGASVILLDEQRQEFFFPVTAYEDREAGRRVSEVRVPADKGVVGHVYRTGQPLIVPDTSKSELYLKEPDLQTGYKHHNVLDVPLKHNDRMIGVLMAVNKKDGPFDQDDVDLLMALAGLVALPLENAHIHHELVRSYEEVNHLNQAKDRVIHHLSHELKTPVAVMRASLQMLRERLAHNPDPALASILGRTDRNLNRILEMQYEIDDLVNKGHYQNYALMTNLLNACQDELEALSADHPVAGAIHEILRRKVDTLFAPREIVSQKIALAPFVSQWLEKNRPAFAHRDLEIVTHLETEVPVKIPAQVLQKIMDGLMRNAVENTPDSGRIEVVVRRGIRGADPGVVMTIRDFGVGMDTEKQRLIRENYFSSSDPLGYGSKPPYTFGAGGKGFDWLRLTIFSERYGFTFSLSSTRCSFLPAGDGECPGRIALCAHCKDEGDCRASGGTEVNVAFKAAQAVSDDEPADSLPSIPETADRQPASDHGPEFYNEPARTGESPERFFHDLKIEFLIHELKTPFAIVETAVRSLLEARDIFGDLNPKQEKVVQRALRNSVKMRSMVNNLLEIGRSETGCFKCHDFNPMQEAVGTLADATDWLRWEKDKFESFDDPARADGIDWDRYHIRVSVSNDAANVCMHQDEVKFCQIITNLVGNALDHRRLWMEMRMTVENGVFRLDVMDDGPGIAEEHQGIIFERYTRIDVDDAANSFRRGHGLGLAGARILARCLGGDIRVESARNQGANFIMELPLNYPGK